jgi:hypothetical protein
VATLHVSQCPAAPKFCRHAVQTHHLILIADEPIPIVKTYTMQLSIIPHEEKEKIN